MAVTSAVISRDVVCARHEKNFIALPRDRQDYLVIPINSYQNGALDPDINGAEVE